MAKDKELKVIEILEKYKHKHLLWAEYFEKFPHKELLPEYRQLGGAEFHRECISDYEQIIKTWNTRQPDVEGLREEIKELKEQLNYKQELIKVYHLIAYKECLPNNAKLTIPQFTLIAINKKFSCGQHYIIYPDELHSFSIPASGFDWVSRQIFKKEWNEERYYEELKCALTSKTTIQQAMKGGE